MIITNSTYTNSAINLAEANNITLIDGKELDKISKLIFK